MRYDLVIDGTVTIEDIEADRPYPNAKQVIENVYMPSIGDGRPRQLGDAPRFSAMAQGDKRSVLILWDRVRTVEVRIRG